jgi:hypothetical protein
MSYSSFSTYLPHISSIAFSPDSAEGATTNPPDERGTDLGASVSNRKFCTLRG